MNVAVIDIDSLIYAAFHPNKIMDEFGNPKRTEDNRKYLYIDKTEEEILESCDGLMHLVLKRSKATHYIGYVKGKDTIKNKLLIDPTYKQDRKEEPPKYWDLCKNYLVDKWGIVEANGAETDDYVNVTRLMLPGAYMVVIDGDLLGLESGEKDHYNWKKNSWVGVSKERADYKFWSDMITGTHNNTKGLPKKGDKFVEKTFVPFLLAGGDDLSSLVFEQYKDHFGLDDGINQFYKNYKMIKILDKMEGFIPIGPIKYEKIEKEDNKFKLDF